ncbi:hypothetical protein GCM10009836_74000 [Pseudonocardia ailaonensis]|uniref:Uncharacterized protein n=1 Tax=Pseudonocardia ailaonensis TaxID=367279 RepID=A0ABN2NS12_9PSEU
MGTTFVQVWVFCLAAFLVGALVTWLAFAAPARREAAALRKAPPAYPGRTGQPPVAPDPVRAAQAPLTPLPGVARHARRAPERPTNPALAGLDGTARQRRRPGTAAVGALDRMRHGPDAGPPQNGQGPAIPAQGGPGARPPRNDAPGGLFTPPEQRRSGEDVPDVPARRDPPEDGPVH